MANSNAEEAPLLGGSDRPASRHSNDSHENTPLLSRNDTPRYDAVEDEEERERIPSPAATSLQSIQDGQVSATKPTKDARRWPTYVAMSILALLAIGIMTGAFFFPAALEEYTKQAVIIEPTNLSVHELTSTGVSVIVEGKFKLDASRVKNNAVRNFGLFVSWVAREVESRPSIVEVYLPEHGNMLIGSAAIPRIAVDVRDGHSTSVEFLAVLEPGNAEDIRRVANDWLEGRLDRIRVMGKADVDLMTGIFPLGTQTIAESMVFEGQSLYRSFASLYFGKKSLFK
jgi:hypothetical protein